jgi:quercetin dioxygenase-like cupin family protein
MGVTNGDRVLINDKKLNGINNTAYAVNVIRNKGLVNIDIITPIVCNKDRIDKPWGYEELVEHNSSYVVKKLFMKKGHSCSIQYHELKTETIVVLKGRLNIYIGNTLETLEKKEYNEGDTITIYPYTIHRMEGVVDCLYLETSTNQLWDVIRLQDAYGRT